MAGGVEGPPGGILAAANEIAEFSEEIEYDLIKIGLRLSWLGTDLLSWRDLIVILRQSPRESAYARAKLGEKVAWGETEHLLAAIFDALQIANWQRGNAGKKAPSPKPKPIPRPGVNRDKGRVGFGAIPIKDFDAWWSGELDDSTARESSASRSETPSLTERLAGEGWRVA